MEASTLQPMRWESSACDQRVHTAVRMALDNSGYRALREVHVVAREGLVILCGRVHSYYIKQIATSVVLKIADVAELKNELRVVPRNGVPLWMR